MGVTKKSSFQNNISKPNQKVTQNGFVTPNLANKFLHGFVKDQTLFDFCV